MAADHPYTKQTEAIESALAYTCRAERLTADAGEEFASWARLRLLEDDCAILRKFKGLSSLRTYMVAVMQRLILDWRISEWGKWRPTVAARRLGPVAVELERLVLRDSIEFEQAAQTLISKGIAISQDECDRIWSELPRRPRRQRASGGALDEIPNLVDERDRVADEEGRAREWRAKVDITSLTFVTTQDRIGNLTCIPSCSFTYGAEDFARFFSGVACGPATARIEGNGRACTGVVGGSISKAGGFSDETYVARDDRGNTVTVSGRVTLSPGP